MLFRSEPKKVRRVLDLCTGSGCLAVLAALAFPAAKVDAVDLSPGALALARRNVATHRLGDRIALHRGDLFAPLAGQRYDLIISNPPYVRGAVMRRLPREYRREPALALAAGEDGLDILRVILANAAKHLHPGGVLVVECGHARTLIERTWPQLPFFWVETSGGDDCVFVLTREELPSYQRVLTGIETNRQRKRGT